MTITAEHVRELATLYGETVLVRMPDSRWFWVIGTGNKHYEGAGTVYATSEQVAEIIDASDYDADGQLTDAGAWRIADILSTRDRSDAVKSACMMKNPTGFSAAALTELDD
ncbi:hypothetical protein ACFZAM_31800 [Streptomyces sp. NPDC008079]|uniref:hypothetical protein n=1 Tax=Streptomyces sp. NPDC008079 TaxID=3364806 RepID=UPI0036E7FEC4